MLPCDRFPGSELVLLPFCDAIGWLPCLDGLSIPSWNATRFVGDTLLGSNGGEESIRLLFQGLSLDLKSPSSRAYLPMSPRLPIGRCPFVNVEVAFDPPFLPTRRGMALISLEVGP